MFTVTKTDWKALILFDFDDNRIEWGQYYPMSGSLELMREEYVRALTEYRKTECIEGYFILGENGDCDAGSGTRRFRN